MCGYEPTHEATGDGDRPALPLAWPAGARSEQHVAGNLDNRHVEIVCAASARVNVRIFYQPLTAPTGLGLLLTLPPRQASPSVGQRAARSLPERWPAVLSRGDAHSQRFKAIDSRTEEGAALIAAPF
jgi:hypothetical protein